MLLHLLIQAERRWQLIASIAIDDLKLRAWYGTGAEVEHHLTVLAAGERGEETVDLGGLIYLATLLLGFVKRHNLEGVAVLLDNGHLRLGLLFRPGCQSLVVELVGGYTLHTLACTGILHEGLMDKLNGLALQ